MTLLTAEERQAMRELSAQIAAWREDDAAGYDAAIALVCQAETDLLRALDDIDAREQLFNDSREQLLFSLKQAERERDEARSHQTAIAYRKLQFKTDQFQRERDEARAEIARLQHDIGTLRHQLFEARADRMTATSAPEKDDAEEDA